MALSRMQFAEWRPANRQHVEVQQALPFTGKHQALGFNEFPMKEEQIAPIMDPSSEIAAKHTLKAPTGATRDITHVYRGMSHEEWKQAQERGHVRSDSRGSIAPEWEGTNAALSPDTAHYYRNTTGAGTGVVAKIAVHPDDKWFLSDVDSYARTRNPVPLSRVQIIDTK